MEFSREILEKILLGAIKKMHFRIPLTAMHSTIPRTAMHFTLGNQLYLLKYENSCLSKSCMVTFFHVVHNYRHICTLKYF